MKVYVSSTVGWGNTELSAFDKALLDTGVANYNLIRLSSVMPPDTEVIDCEGAIPTLPGSWGDRLYVVYAEMRTSLAGQEAWAGVGWVQDPVSKKGLFVEHEGHSEDSVRSDIETSLKDLMRNRGMEELPISTRVIGGVCQDHPICAYVVIAFQVSDWSNTAYLQ
jgi:arginine decarboxylase